MHRLLAAAVLIALAACGGGDEGSGAASNSEVRTVEVDMVDIAFEPESVAVKHGERVRFRFTNRGEVAHDAFIGDSEAQAEHGAEMRSNGDDGHGGGHDDDAEAVTVEPGDTGELTYTFEDDAALEIGCHQPGHYDAGMKIAVEVT